MPLYYFQIAGDDDAGTELPDDSAAREEARETFGAMIRDGTVDHAAQMTVLDATGRRVAVFSFSAE